VRFLDEFVTLLDSLVDKHIGVTKIKTIGDAYFAVAGLTTEESNLQQSRNNNNSDMSTAVNNLVSLVEFCLDAQEAISHHRFAVVDDARYADNDVNDVEQQRLLGVLRESFSDDGYLKIRVRIGVHWGDVVAGIVGSKHPVSLCVRERARVTPACSNTMFGVQHAISH
jgi:class 3 adenylate cyclase